MAISLQVPTSATIHTIPSLFASGDSVILYNRDAQPVKDAASETIELSDTGNLLLCGVVDNLVQQEIPIARILKHGRVLAMSGGKGLVLQQSEDKIVFYSILPRPVSVMDIRSTEGFRNILKTAFAGWHHVFHEVFAAASNFKAKIMGNLTEEKLVRVI